MNIGFIGLGAMGAPMARNLLRKGFAVTVHSRTRAREEPLAALGAAPASTPAEAASGADVVITMVGDTPDVEEVLFGEAGVAQAAPRGAVVVDMSTIDPEATRDFAGRLAERGIRMVDAPVSGGTEGAASGTLSIMVGGEDEDVAGVRPVLEALGKTITHVGPAGSGQMTKAINQVIIAGTFLAVAEGMALGTKAGLDMVRVLEALRAGAAGSWVLEARAPRMLAGEYPLGFKLSLHRKDLAIALRAAERAGVDLPGARLVSGLEDSLLRRGFGDQDMSAIAEAVLPRRSEGID